MLLNIRFEMMERRFKAPPVFLEETEELCKQCIAPELLTFEIACNARQPFKQYAHSSHRRGDRCDHPETARLV